MRVLAFLLLTTSTVAAPICRPDANDMLTVVQQRGGAFVDLVDDPKGKGWDQVMVVEVEEHLEGVLLRNGCAIRRSFIISKAPVRL